MEGCLRQLTCVLARYDGRIKGFLYLVPGLSLVDGLRKVTDDESMRDMIQLAEKYRGVEVRSSSRKKSQPLNIVEPSQKTHDSSLKPKKDEPKKDALTDTLKKDAPTESVSTQPTTTLSNQSSFRVKYVINPSSETATPLPTLSSTVAASNTEADPLNSYEWEDSRPDSPIPINDLIPDYSTDSDNEDPPYNPLVDKGKGVSSNPFFGKVYTDESDGDEDTDGEQAGGADVEGEVEALEELEEEYEREHEEILDEDLHQDVPPTQGSQAVPSAPQQPNTSHYNQTSQPTILGRGGRMIAMGRGSRGGRGTRDGAGRGYVATGRGAASGRGSAASIGAPTERGVSCVVGSSRGGASGSRGAGGGTRGSGRASGGSRGRGRN
uniref:Uncharacterized protein n=1 Tax=Chenopodium quinoa TaxID=63459 RepID=A0A803MWQ4_CHEQI